METTIFNPIQQHLLRMFSFNRSEESLQEMMSALTEFYAKKVDSTFNKLWDDGVLNQDKLDEIRHTDLHDLLKKS
jgi:hypothetical protein